jgi:PAS domain S-box-containing protein
MSGLSRSVLRYALAILIPVAFGVLWPHQLAGRPIAISPFFLCIAVIARFFGFGPALVCALTSAATLSISVFPTASYPMDVQIGRLLLFLLSSVTVASISRQRSTDVREAEERYRTLVDLSPDGIFVRDEENRIVFANQALVRMLGLSSAADLIGKTAFDFVDRSFHEVVKARVAEVNRDQTAPWLEEIWIRSDGTKIDVEVAGVPMRRRGKRFSQVFVRDLSQKKHSEAAIEENRRRMNAVFDGSIDGMIFIDESGAYVDANPAACELLGYRRDELLKLRAGDVVRPASRPAALKVWEKIRSGMRIAGEFTIQRKDGSEREVEYRGVGNVLPGLHFALMRDITARKEAEVSLQRLSGRLLHLQDEERKRIALQLHETTAQTLIALKLNLAKGRRSSEGSGAAFRETLDESVALVEQSINEVRTLSYLLHPPMIEEMGLVSSLRWFAGGFEERTGIHVTVEAPDDLRRLPSAVETSLFRIVQEALTNVQRHSQSKVARITLSRESAAIRLSVEDEGRGLAERLRGQPLEVVAASGVGVAGMYQRVRDLSGTMSIQSDDHRTRVEVSLPVGAD